MATSSFDSAHQFSLSGPMSSSCSLQHWLMREERVILVSLTEIRKRTSEAFCFSFSSVAQSCLTLCDPINCSTPGLPVYHQLPEFTLAVQGTLKSLLQHHSSKASIFLALNLLYGPTFTSVHDYWKNHSSDYMDLCLCFLNMLSRFFS